MTHNFSRSLSNMAESRAEDNLAGDDTSVITVVPKHRHSSHQQDPTDDEEQLSADSDVEDDRECIEVADAFLQDNSLVPRYGPQNAKLSNSWISLLQNGNKKYPLRDKDRTNFRGSGWLDLDETGNYDPTNEHKRVARPVKVLKEVLVEHNDSDKEHANPKRHQPRTASYGYGRRTGRSHVVALNVKTPDGIEKLKVLTTNYQSSGEQVEAQENLDSHTGRSISQRESSHTQHHSHTRYEIFLVLPYLEMVFAGNLNCILTFPQGLWIAWMRDTGILRERLVKNVI